MSMSRVPWRSPTRCCVCFVMEDILPSFDDDGRQSTIDCQGHSRMWISGDSSRPFIAQSLWPDETCENVGRRSTMTTQQVADTLVKLCSEGKFEEATKALYSPDIVSVEAGAP